jgi:P-type Cu+ transporter
MAGVRLARAARGRSNDGRTGSRPVGGESAPGGETTAGTQEVSLSIEGMTCAACAVRIEKKLNRLDEVRATVNHATASLRVTAPAAMPVADLIAAAGRAGTRPAPAPAPSGRRAGGELGTGRPGR